MELAMGIEGSLYFRPSSSRRTVRSQAQRRRARSLLRRKNNHPHPGHAHRHHARSAAHTGSWAPVRPWLPERQHGLQGAIDRKGLPRRSAICFGERGIIGLHLKPIEIKPGNPRPKTKGRNARSCPQIKHTLAPCPPRNPCSDSDSGAKTLIRLRGWFQYRART